MASLLQNIEAIKDFKRSFWVANIMELFERVAYYGQAAIVSVFLRDHIHLDEIQAGRLTSLFGALIYSLPIFAGALADRIGFRKAFSIAFLVLGIGYTLLGACGLPAFSGIVANFGIFQTLAVLFIFTAMGGSFIKPSVLGTVALTTDNSTKSTGYAIYYWLVNIGGAIGPLLAFLVGIQYVYFVSGISCILMFIATIMFYKEPERKNVGPKGSGTEAIIGILKNLWEVVTNFKIMFLLMIFALYWLMFWQEFIVLPYFIKDFISVNAPFELISSVGPMGIILLQLPVNFMTKWMRTETALVVGFVISSLCWLIILTSPSIPLIIAGVLVFSIGEQIQAPRFYEYMAEMAPAGREALYQGFSFLPIAIAWGFGGIFGGTAYKYFAKNAHNPGIIFQILFGIGILATLLMFVYTRIYGAKKKEQV
ncbi:MAG: MFS transporter [Ignavibacteria bacterium]|nr:MFS transporter [Ignavibacteria bacterium]